MKNLYNDTKKSRFPRNACGEHRDTTKYLNNCSLRIILLLEELLSFILKKWNMKIYTRVQTV